MGRKKIEVHPGEVYGRLTILKEVEPHIQPSGQKHRMVLVQCDCGSDPVEVRLDNLRRGHTTSCGCYNIEKFYERTKKFNTYELDYETGVGTGFTDNGDQFLFDVEDYDKIKDYCWSLTNDGYVRAYDGNCGKMIWMHRLVMNCPEDKIVDHINHCKSNNCKSNLRICTTSENAFNVLKRKNNTSGVTGVDFHKDSNKWRSRICINGKRIVLGTFDTKEEAIEARLKAEIDFHGTFSPNYEKLMQSQSQNESSKPSE